MFPDVDKRRPMRDDSADDAPAVGDGPAALKPRWRRTPDWRVLPPPDAALEIAVIVPVRNEAQGLPATLRALASQRDEAGRPLDPRRFEIIVLANNCSDASAAVIRRFAAARPRTRLHVVEVTFPRSCAHVGHARACLMNEACRRLAMTAGPRGVIASTDGDTRVAPDWLAATLTEMRCGVDAVGGRIVMDDAEPAPRGLVRMTRRDHAYQTLRSRLEHAIDPDPCDPWPRHHQHFGASLAVTVDAYRTVGGLPAEPFLEDEAMVEALRERDLKLRHSDRVVVVTSNRRHGRVAVGLSWQLREWAELARVKVEAMVPVPSAWAAELHARRRLRECWRAMRANRETGSDAAGRVARDAGKAVVAELAAELAVAAAWLERCVVESDTFGALWRAVGERRARLRRRVDALPMSDAIVALRELLASERRRQRPQRLSSRSSR